MMKNLKKVLALVLVFAMSLSVVAFAGTTYPDVADDATYAEATSILKSLGIMVGDDQGNFNPDKVVTRAEMATILCNVAGVGKLAPVDSGFVDATAAHWASGYISYARNAGWVNGRDAYTYDPDGIVKYEEAIKLVMAALNYGIYADEQGGYPTGWLMAAAEAEVTKAGATGSIGEDCTRAKIAMIVYYALDADMMKQTAFGDKKWEIIKGETLLTKYLDTYKVEGKVMDSYKLNEKLEEGYVAFTITNNNDIDISKELGVDGTIEDKKTVYKIAEIDAAGTNAADLLAYSTVAYIHKDADGELSIAAIAAKGAKNKEYVITDMDLVYDEVKDAGERANRKPNFDTEKGELKFSYWTDRDEDNAISYVEIDPSVVIVKNNTKVDTKDVFCAKQTVTAGLAAIVPTSGSITLIDTDNDADIDLIDIKAYAVAVVDAVNASKAKIIFKDKVAGIAGSIILDKEEIEELTDISITLDGAAIDVADLKENDVLTFSTNDFSGVAPRYYDIIVTRNVVEGKITSKNDTKSYIYIDGNEYEFVGNGLSIDYSDVKLNDEGKFYLAANGKVAYFDDETIASTNYAIVNKFVKDSMDVVSMQIFTLEGVKLTANVAEKVELNGEKVVLAEKVDAATLTATGLAIADPSKYVDTLTWYDLIKAIVDGTEDILAATEGKINKLITYDVSNDEIDEIAFAIASTKASDFGYVGTVKDAEWDADNNRFKASKTLSNNTVIFNIAETAIEDWKVSKIDSLVDENLYTPYYFANQNDGTVGAVIILDSQSTISQDASLAFYVDYRTGVYEVNGDDEDVAYVNYYVDGALATEALAVDLTYWKKQTIKTGDAFLFSKNDKGIVEKIVPVYSIADNKFSADLGKDKTDLDDFMMYDAGAKKDNEVFYGVLLSAANGKLKVAPAPKGSDTVIDSDAFLTIAVADSAKVLQYKSYASTDAKKLAACDSIVDLETSSYLRVSGTQNVKLDSDADLTYVFFRMNNGVVTEVVGIDLKK